jgi:hypothetical protein
VVFGQRGTPVGIRLVDEFGGEFGGEKKQTVKLFNNAD